MKKEFYGFYEPSLIEIDKSWNNGFFVFDANTLLNLYRYSDSTRKDFLMVITKLKEKLFMPYQVGYEYHSNRHNVIESLDKSYDTLLTSIKETCDKTITNTINQYLRHPSIHAENLKKTLDEFQKKIDSELEKQKNNHPDFKSKDEILLQLTELYENKVGTQFTTNELKKIYIEGKDRYEQQIPPGYKDLETKRKKGDQHIYGDLIIWKEIIDLTKKEKKEIIFITDDRKEDWWTIENGKTIRPREELIKEFYDLTGVRILIYNADNFLHYAKERKLVSKIKEESISEVKEVRKSDENLIKISDYLTSTQWHNTSGTKIADLLKSTNDLTHWSGSTIAELLKNTNDLTHWSNPTGSTIAELLKNTNDLTHWSNPTGSTVTELLKNTNDLTHWYNPTGSTVTESLKNKNDLNNNLIKTTNLETSSLLKNDNHTNNTIINKEETKLKAKDDKVENLKPVEKTNDLKKKVPIKKNSSNKL